MVSGNHYYSSFYLTSCRYGGLETISRMTTDTFCLYPSSCYDNITQNSSFDVTYITVVYLAECEAPVDIKIMQNLVIRQFIAVTQGFRMFVGHVTRRCQCLFPASPNLRRKNSGNDVGGLCLVDTNCFCIVNEDMEITLTYRQRKTLNLFFTMSWNFLLG